MDPVSENLNVGRALISNARTCALTVSTSGDFVLSRTVDSDAASFSLGRIRGLLKEKLNPFDTTCIEGGAEVETDGGSSLESGGKGMGVDMGVGELEDDSAWKLNLNLLGSLGMELGLKLWNCVLRDSWPVLFDGFNGSLSFSLSISTSSRSSTVTSARNAFVWDGSSEEDLDLFLGLESSTSSTV